MHALWSIRNFLRARPWIWIIIGFVVVMLANIHFIQLAIKHRPQTVPLVTENPSTENSHD
jgi:hypothetical protein